jgi:predicted small lipoprotein YifL
MNPRRFVLAAFLFVLLAAGCGKKGPLYLPPDSPPSTPPAALSP